MIKTVNMKVIILDGIGINLKTTVIEQLRKEGHIVLTSDTSYYTENPKALPHYFDIYSRAFARYISIKTVVDALKNTNTPAIFVDRGVANHLAWFNLVHTNIDKTSSTYNEYLKLKELVELEKDLNTEHLLIINENKKLISDGLDPKNDITNKRLEVFKSVDNYLQMQEQYVNNYPIKYANRIKISDGASLNEILYEKFISELVAFIIEEVKQLANI